MNLGWIKSVFSTQSQPPSSRGAEEGLRSAERVCKGGTSHRRSRKSWLIIGWLLVAICFLGPTFALLVAGCIWFGAQGWFAHWFVAAIVLGTLGSILAKRLHRNPQVFPGPQTQPPLEWPPRDHAIWGEVEKIALEKEKAPFPLDDLLVWQQVGQEVFEVVARHYHPRSNQPILEVPAPYILAVVERVAQDLRGVLQEQFPFSHLLTVGDLLRMKQMASYGQYAYQAYKWAQLGVNPGLGLLRFFRDLVFAKLQEKSVAAIQRWLAGYIVRRMGYYAIMLYGGHITLDQEGAKAFRSPKSQKDWEQAVEWEERLNQEPLRVVVFGRVGAGKSSVINVLLDEVKAPVGVGGSRAKTQTYAWHDVKGHSPVLLIEPPGFDPAKAPTRVWRHLYSEVQNADLLLLVIPGNAADWEVEAALLRNIRQDQVNHPERVHAPLAVVVTQPGPASLDAGQVSKGSRESSESVGSLGDPGEYRERWISRVRELLELSEHVPVVVGEFRGLEESEGHNFLREAFAQLYDRAKAARVNRCVRGQRRAESWYYGGRQLLGVVRNVPRLFGGKSRE